MYTVELDNITAYYKKSFFAKEKVLENIDLKLKPSRIHGLLGPNAAGKTTLIKTILGLIRRYEGFIYYYKNEERIRIEEWLFKAGYVSEDVNLPLNISGLQFLKLMGGFYYLGATKLDERINSVLNITELYDSREKKINSYSKGMKKRMLIAQSLINKPKILFLDEPMAGLDPIQRRSIRSLLNTLRDQGVTILISSHELFEIELLCDSIFFIENGKIILSEDLRDMSVMENEIFVYTDSFVEKSELEKLKDFNYKKLNDEIIFIIRKKELNKLLNTLDNINIEINKIKTSNSKFENKYFQIYRKNS